MNSLLYFLFQFFFFFSNFESNNLTKEKKKVNCQQKWQSINFHSLTGLILCSDNWVTDLNNVTLIALKF